MKDKGIKMEIHELADKKGISFNDKIEIFKKFMKTGQNLNGKTIFEGHPIGQWAIQIRNQVKRNKQGKKSQNFSEEQLEILADLGILERQIDSTIDEKLDRLIKWNKMHPNYCPAQNISLYSLPIELRDEFNKMQRYYDYLKQRNYKGKLTKEQISRCKNGNVRGIFGYPESTEKIAHEYRQNIDWIDTVLSEYNSVNEFVAHTMEYPYLNILRKYYEINLRSDKGVEKLLKNVYSESIVYDYDTVLEQLNQLPENQRKVLIEGYGINGVEVKKDAKIAEEIGVSITSVSNYRAKALKTLRKSKKDLCITIIPDFKKIREEDRQKIVEALGNYVFFPSAEYKDEQFTYNIENLNRLVEICQDIEKYGTTTIASEEKQTNQDKIYSFSNAKQEYQRILGEEKQRNEGGISDSATPRDEKERIEDEKKKSELERLREKKDGLLEEQKNLQARLAQIKELLVSYDRLNGNLQENQIPNLDDK